MAGIGTTELLIVLAIVVLIFGGSKLPQVGRALRQFKDEVSGDNEKTEKPSIEARERDGPDQS